MMLRIGCFGDCSVAGNQRRESGRINGARLPEVPWHCVIIVPDSWKQQGFWFPCLVSVCHDCWHRKMLIVSKHQLCLGTPLLTSLGLQETEAQHCAWLLLPKKVYMDFNFQGFFLLGQGTLLLNSIFMNNGSYGALCITAYALYFNAVANIMTKVLILWRRHTQVMQEAILLSALAQRNHFRVFKRKGKKATNQQGKYNISIILYVKVIFFRWCVFLNVSLFLTLFYVALGFLFFIAKGGLEMQSPHCGRRQALLLGLCGQLQSDFRGTQNAASDADGISLCCDCTALQRNGFNLIIWLFHFAYIYNLPDLWGKGRTGSQSCWRHFKRSEQYSIYHYNSQALQFGDSALTTKIGRQT